MFPKTACRRRCIITLAAYVWLFSSVCFQITLQVACLIWCKVTLVAFVWVLSTVRLKMFFKLLAKEILVAFVWVLSTVLLNFFLLQIACKRNSNCTFRWKWNAKVLTYIEDKKTILGQLSRLKFFTVDLYFEVIFFIRHSQSAKMSTFGHF